MHIVSKERKKERKRDREKERKRERKRERKKEREKEMTDARSFFDFSSPYDSINVECIF